jgi:hypothetical protein
LTGRYLQWLKGVAAQLRATEWSATQEASLKSRDAGRLHFHAYLSWIKRSKGVDLKTLNAFVFETVAPRVDVNSEHRGEWHWKKATYHGHFYTAVWKLGTLQAATNITAFEDYDVDGPWVQKLFRHRQLDHTEYERLSAECRDGGHARRMHELEAVRRSERKVFIAKRKAEATELLGGKRKKFKAVYKAMLHSWLQQYASPNPRYILLVLVGRSWLGKSELAKEAKGPQNTLVVDCQNAAHPDLHEFDPLKHQAIVMDDISGTEFVVQNKKLLQQHVDGAKLGQSPTQTLVYDAWLWRLPVVVTTNKWSYENLDALDVDWLEKNCEVREITEEVWERGA